MKKCLCMSVFTCYCVYALKRGLFSFHAMIKLGFGWFLCKTTFQSRLCELFLRKRTTRRVVLHNNSKSTFFTLPLLETKSYICWLLTDDLCKGFSIHTVG